MGLFKKRVEGIDEVRRLRDEISAMAARLAASEEARAGLDRQVTELGDRLADGTAVTTRLDGEVRTLGARIDAPGDGDVAARLDVIADELARQRRTTLSVVDRVDGLSARFEGDTPPPPDAPPVDAQLGEVRAQLERLLARVDEVDARVTSIATELAHQIDELGGELDRRPAVAGDADLDGADDAVLAELRDAQVRLASEQARYQIAFRHDLAELAARLKR